mgnify:FL=1
MRINTNIMAINSYRQLSSNQVGLGKSLEKLSSGLRINRAGDDSAGLAISEKMRAQIRGLDQAQRNAQDGISLIQTAEGALNETHAILQRMRELAVQAANDTVTTSDRTALTAEITQLNAELDRIAENTTFNGQNLLDGTLGVTRVGGTLTNTVEGLANLSDIDVAGAVSGRTYTISATGAGVFSLTDGTTSYKVTLSAVGDGENTLDFAEMGISIKTDSTLDVSTTAFDGLTIITSGTSATFHIGPDNTTGQTLSVSIDSMTSSDLSVDSISVTSSDNARSAITSIDSAIDSVSAERGEIGSYQNRLEYSISNLGTASENVSASESRIRDVDMANEMMNFTRDNILIQAATAMLAQANMQPQAVLQLLQ